MQSFVCIISGNMAQGRASSGSIKGYKDLELENQIKLNLSGNDVIFENGEWKGGNTFFYYTILKDSTVILMAIIVNFKFSCKFYPILSIL